MEIKYRKSKMDGLSFSSEERERKVSNKFTKCNLDIYQLCNLANIDTLLENLDELWAGLILQNRDNEFLIEQLRDHFEQLADQSQKIIWAIAQIEDDLKTCESFTFETPAREI